VPDGVELGVTVDFAGGEAVDFAEAVAFAVGAAVGATPARCCRNESATGAATVPPL
jgi:hypothetical protein